MGAQAIVCRARLFQRSVFRVRRRKVRLVITMRSVYFLSSMSLGVLARPSLPVPEFAINLDLDPEERFVDVTTFFKPILMELKAYLNTVVVMSANEVAYKRGPENDELMGEIRSYAKVTGFTVNEMHAAQLLYEFQTVMVPIENSTRPTFGCTGIIARAHDDGTVYHARNLDFSFASILGNMTYNGIFHKNGKEIFTAQMIAGYSSPLTGIRRGPNGWTIEINTRYPLEQWGIEDLYEHIFVQKRETSGWVKRKTLENVDNWEDAVMIFRNHPYAAPEYNIISGVGKGTILARSPDKVMHTLTLGPNRNDYIIMTNFDYWDHDIKEWLDPTSMTFGHSRRIGAEKILNISDINADLLYKVLNSHDVIAKDTIFQMLANVEKNWYVTFLPDCESCSGCKNHGECISGNETCCEVRTHYTHNCGTLGWGGFKCGCLADGVCRDFYWNETAGDQDCCSFESHRTLECPGSFRRCGKATAQAIHV